MKLPIALITGAGTGLGKELARLLSKTHHVVLVGRRDAELMELAEEINLSGSATPLTCDISQQDQVTSLEKQLLNLSLLPVDIVVNNAGVGHFGSLETNNIEEWNQMFQTNVYGPMLITKTFLPYMKESKGKFINILSTAALRGKVNESGYVASKFAFRGFSESIAKEVEPHGIRVIRAYMGGMNTPFWESSSHVENAAAFRTPSEVAEIIISRMDSEDEIVIESRK
ncbi:SDR family oxidoreductase [Jeotgalibacillus sp. S-D1]|uniref:SDR family NAD(P)-dependent oxidoreductase n=1 Tax=Jeotgalibacillus sp. S-D1 TaxID=2552189 RepID=UPI00105A5781|nr:SDR family oxidoreductase [Jeotgalibacillus sp. S-D1]TDL30656.1 SDR family oxidoreductase [Jeotgalibacillus sp. S-D1]